MIDFYLLVREMKQLFPTRVYSALDLIPLFSESFDVDVFSVTNHKKCRQ